MSSTFGSSKIWCRLFFSCPIAKRKEGERIGGTWIMPSSHDARTKSESESPTNITAQQQQEFSPRVFQRTSSKYQLARRAPSPTFPSASTPSHSFSRCGSPFFYPSPPPFRPPPQHNKRKKKPFHLSPPPSILGSNINPNKRTQFQSIQKEWQNGLLAQWQGAWLRLTWNGWFIKRLQVVS